MHAPLPMSARSLSRFPRGTSLGGQSIRADGILSTGFSVLGWWGAELGRGRSVGAGL
jgi:hypothetical protein